MNSQSDIDIALDAAKQPVMIESDVGLQNAGEKWLDCELIGIDTEFVRERTWRADFGLMQISDGETVWLVDPLKAGPLEAIASLLEAPHVLKVLHAPSEDLDVLLYNTGAVPTPLFDTQTACAMLGQSLQMGYHKTVEWLLNITIDKGETRSNWIKRPLRPAQLHYAALDVCLLPMMFRQLAGKLVELDRLEWLQEDCNRMLTKALTPADPQDAWKRINGNGRLDPTALAILQPLARWRDQIAENRNLARGFVIKDNDMLTIASQQPRDLATLSELNVWHPKPIQRYGHDVLNIINEVLEQGITAEPPATLLPTHRPIMNDMRKRVKAKASELNIDPALLASKRELEGLILSPAGDPPSERYLGWRYDIITNDLLAVKRRYD